MSKVKRPGSDIHVVYKLLKKELPNWKFKLSEDNTEPELDSIWVESDKLTTYMDVADGSLWISDDCRKHLDYFDCQCDEGCFVIKLADPEFIEAVDSILYGMAVRRTAITTISKDPWAIEDRDIRISQLEELLKKNKIKVPK